MALFKKKSAVDRLDAKSRKDPIKQTNWERLRSKSFRDDPKGRDVFEQQQLERSEIEKPQTFARWNILAVVLSALVAVLVYFFIGVMLALFAWLSTLAGSIGVLTDGGSAGSGGHGSYDVYWIEDYDITPNGMHQRYQAIDENGVGYGPWYEFTYEIPKPDWVIAAEEAEAAATESGAGVSDGEIDVPYYLLIDQWPWRLLAALLIGLLTYAILRQKFQRLLAAQNADKDVTDINQYKNDQHIALPEEIQRKFDWFPDAGAHSSVSVSSMISHMALQNKGLKKVEMAERAKERMFDEDGTLIFEKDEILTDEDGDPIVHSEPILDLDFMDALFDASGAQDDPSVRKYYDPNKIPYNPGNKNREKLSGYDTVADLINGDWDLPLYEPQRPGGAYIVDTAPVNTMVLAITRAGKGQTIIEPTIDMWTREKEPNNMVINDPKGELLVKNYVRGVMRGFAPVQFNLINPMNTDIYNPLVLAANAAREGDFSKCSLYVNNIADVFFPLDGGEDPVWPNAANNAFKRAALGLIDYFLEEEREMKIQAEKAGMAPRLLATKIDILWGQCTLYNCYQLFVQLTSKKLKNPLVEFVKKAKEGYFDPETGQEPLTEEEYDAKMAEVEWQGKELWEDKPEADLLTLYYNATAKLPVNEMRQKVLDANNSLRAMGGADKMIASVYGIAITAMAFFTDPTILTLTSGTPSQNVDLSTLSFPRTIGVRFHPDFVSRYKLAGLQARWTCYRDANFTDKYEGKDFYHEEIVSREGWARGYFKGIFEGKEGYLRLELTNANTNQLVRTMYFRFQKSYQTTLDGRTYVKDKVLHEKIVRDGLLTELAPQKQKDGSVVYKPCHTTFKQRRMVDIATDDWHEEMVDTQAIIGTLTRYAEKPKMVFLVTPPHLMAYAKLILILIKQLVDLNFDKSYMTKPTQKPLYKTRYMLDELGNLQSEGHGISGFETMLSIGLGQDQQFTLILQTLQQLRDVYGESVDKIVQGNAQTFDSLIATPDGWKRFGDVKVGDVVLNRVGKSTVIQGVFPRGKRKVYRVTRRDGSFVDVCNEHLWRVKVS